MGQPVRQGTQRIQLSGHEFGISLAFWGGDREERLEVSTCSGGTGDDQFRHVVRDWWWMSMRGWWRDVLTSNRRIYSLRTTRRRQRRPSGAVGTRQLLARRGDHQELLKWVKADQLDGYALPSAAASGVNSLSGQQQRMGHIFSIPT
jgi:hypothetical protein